MSTTNKILKQLRKVLPTMILEKGDLKKGESEKEFTIEKFTLDNKVFSEIPKYDRKRIFGVENEYGVINPDFDKLYRKSIDFCSNGSRIYEDCEHVEFASPETSNPLEVVVYGKAGELMALKFADKVFKNNVDVFSDKTFGSHENYFTKAKHDNLRGIIPFLVSRQIFSGSGKVNCDGSFEISQRSSFIGEAFGDYTTRDRAILCTKNENLSNVNGWHRLHLILGDANMCEVADFLKFGTTGLVLDLVEDSKLPIINYDYGYAVSDIHNISHNTDSWSLEGVHDKRSFKATTMQRKFLHAAKKAYSGRDEITDYLLFRWEDTLKKLDNNPKSLFGVVDWVTKKALIDNFVKSKDYKMTDSFIHNIDLQYHDVDRDKGLFYALQKQGKIERLITDKMIEYAVDNPPKDTRANIRGYAVSNEKKISSISWSCWRPTKEFGRIGILNPFDNYSNLKEKINLRNKIKS